MYDNIVVPLDGSKLAEVALPYAEEIAAKMGYNINLLTVLESEDLKDYEKYWKYINKIEQRTKSHAEKYMGIVGSKTVEVKTVTRNGYPAKMIIDFARKTRSMIVMASHGRSGLSRWAAGSVADNIVSDSRYQPVLIIRAKESRSDIREKRLLKKVLVPLDGSERSSKIIGSIIDFVGKLRMELTLLQVVPQKNQAYKDAETYLQSECGQLEKEGILSKYRVGVGNAADVILDVADDLTIDLTAMSTRGNNNGMNILSLGSVARKIFLGGDSPLLLARY